MSHLILPVTKDLIAALDKAFEQNARMEVVGKASDHNDFYPVVEALDGLTTAVLHAHAQGFLTVRPTIGARFDCGPETNTARNLSSAVGYLRDTASPLLKKGASALQKYSGQNAVEAWAHLIDLYQAVIGSIQRMVREDLEAAESIGPGQLIRVAESAYGVAHPRAKDDSKN